MNLLLLVALLLSSPLRAENAFMGHYGYMLTYSEDYSAIPSFSGDIEKADLFPLKCKGLSRRMDCAKIGMVELAVMPKAMVVQAVGAKTFDAYIKTVLGDAKEAGLKASLRRDKRAGFPAALIAMPGHPQPLNTMILVEGAKVYYRFKYNGRSGAKAAAAMADSLKELAPHDNPPDR